MATATVGRGKHRLATWHIAWAARCRCQVTILPLDEETLAAGEAVKLEEAVQLGMTDLFNAPTSSLLFDTHRFCEGFNRRRRLVIGVVGDTG